MNPMHVVLEYEQTEEEIHQSILDRRDGIRRLVVAIIGLIVFAGSLAALGVCFAGKAGYLEAGQICTSSWIEENVPSPSPRNTSLRPTITILLKCNKVVDHSTRCIEVRIPPVYPTRSPSVHLPHYSPTYAPSQ